MIKPRTTATFYWCMAVGLLIITVVSNNAEGVKPRIAFDRALDIHRTPEHDAQTSPHITVFDFRNAFNSNELSAQTIANIALNRIGTTDDRYQAVLNTDPRYAHKNAQYVDTYRSRWQAEGALLSGVPILIKDNIETKEWPTTAGSLALADNLTGRDAKIVERLRKNGAIVIGKTNLSEWANFRSEHSISGWSAIGGQTGNAHNVSRSPCGSSSGSAVAVALGYVPLAIGTETSGSIVCPASVNGVVGFKPTHGLLSADGIVPLALTQDTAGPITRSVTGAALALAAMIDSAPSSTTNKALQRDQLTALKHDLIRVAEGHFEHRQGRLGILTSTRGYDLRRDNLLNEAVAELKHIGFDIVELPSPQPYPEFWADAYDVLLYEFKRDLNNYLSSLPNEPGTLNLSQLIEFNTQHADAELAYFGQDIFVKAENLKLSKTEYERKLSAIRDFSRSAMTDTIDKHQLDALIGITVGPGWMIDQINGDAFFGPSAAGLPAISGNPHITVPAGDISGMPVGLSFIGLPFQDAYLASIADQFQRSRQK